MTARTRLAAYLVMGAVGPLLALLLGRPEPAALAAPMLLLAVLALAGPEPSELDVTVRLDRERALEGDLVQALVTLRNRGPAVRARVDLALPPTLALESQGKEAWAALAAGSERTLVAHLRCRRWGGVRVGAGCVEVSAGALGALGILYRRQPFDARSGNQLRVYPRGEALQRLVPALSTQVFAGNRVSRQKGEGIEFADIRLFQPGDVVRRVNWRASARQGRLHVNQHHLERNADLVIFLDTFTDLRAGGSSTVSMAVRAAAALVEQSLAQRDRVGLVSFGGTLRWLRPALGEVQLYRILDSLIDTQVTASFAWKGIEVIPPRTLTPGSLVVALTPLLDERTVSALGDLRGRGHDVAILEVDPAWFVPPGASGSEVLAHRTWRLERAALRARFRQLGVPLATWSPGGALADALEEVRAFRRSARVARA